MLRRERLFYEGLILLLTAWVVGWCASAGRWRLGLALAAWCVACGIVVALWNRR